MEVVFLCIMCDHYHSELDEMLSVPGVCHFCFGAHECPTSSRYSELGESLPVFRGPV
jgi:hypothetical protein